MKRKWLAIGIILLFVGTCIIPTFAQTSEKSQPTSRGSWLYVGGSGPGNYTRIQDAINASSDGNTVFVYDDSSPYLENILIDKSISVVGEDCNSTVILGNSSTDIMNINRERVLLSGFTIEISDDYPTELSIDANHARISNNILKNITISSGRQYKVFIVGNIFKMNCSVGNSIVFNYMNDSIIEGNIFYGNRSLAVELAGCKKCEIKSNTINSILGIWVVFNGYSNIIANNTINSSEFCISYCGINGRIENNTVSNAYEGITIGFAIFTRVSRNVVKNCEIGISDGFSLLSFISSNDFENNKIDAMVVDSFFSKWRGNYWVRPRILPKYVLTIFGLPGDPDNGPGLIIPWFKFDFRPASKPNHSSS